MGALVTSGCGTASDEDAVRSASTRFLAAYQARSGAEACAQLSPALRRQVMQDQQAKTCAAGVLKLKLPDVPVKRVRVFATSAIVDLDGESLFLGATGRTWHIDALGCRPGAARAPYDCQEQA